MPSALRESRIALPVTLPVSGSGERDVGDAALERRGQLAHGLGADRPRAHDQVGARVVRGEQALSIALGHELEQLRDTRACVRNALLRGVVPPRRRG